MFGNISLMDFSEHPTKLRCSIVQKYQNRCSLTPSENGTEDTIGILRIITSLLSLLGCTAIILLVVVKRQIKNPKVHPIFALAMTDILLSILWICGSSAWLMGIENRHLCFLISVPTVILECVTVNFTFVYAILAYYGIRSKKPETLLLQRPDSEMPTTLSQRATAIAYLVAGALPAVIVVLVFGSVVISSNYKMVTEANDCSCWCFPTLGNVLPLAIPVDKTTAHYTHHIYILETMYGAIVGTHYLVVFILLVVVYTKSLLHIKKLKQQLDNNYAVSSLVQVIKKGQTRAKRSVFAFLTVFLVSGLCYFFLAYTILGLEIHFFTSAHVHSWTSPTMYHELRKTKRIQLLFVLLYLQSLTVPLQGFLNAIVYAWTKDGFLQVMGIPGADNDDIIEYDDNDRLDEQQVDEDIEGSLTQGACSRTMEDSASIRSTPIDTVLSTKRDSHDIDTDCFKDASNRGGYHTC